MPLDRQLVVEHERLGRRSPRVLLGVLPGGPAHPRAQVGVGDEALQPVGQRVRVTGGDEKAGAPVVDDERDAADDDAYEESGDDPFAESDESDTGAANDNDLGDADADGDAGASPLIEPRD